MGERRGGGGGGEGGRRRREEEEGGGAAGKRPPPTPPAVSLALSVTTLRQEAIGTPGFRQIEVKTQVLLPEKI